MTQSANGLVVWGEPHTIRRARGGHVHFPAKGYPKKPRMENKHRNWDSSWSIDHKYNNSLLRPELPWFGLKCLVWAKETIIYRLVMKNPSYEAYFPFLPLLRENGPPRTPLMVWGLLFNRKVGPLGEPFGSTVISKLCFQNVQWWAPHLIHLI